MSKKSIFIEDVAYGIYDRPGPTGKVADAEESPSMIEDEVPLSPSQHMSNQLTVQRPPIEDDDYVPASIEELSRAASAVAQMTPNESIEYFYRQLHKLLDDATDKAAETLSDNLEKEEEMAVKETYIRSEIRRLIIEAGPNWSDDDLSDYDEFRSGGYSIEEEEPEETQRQEMSLDDLAKEFGYSGPPGVRQEIERLTNRLSYFAAKVKHEDLEALVKYGTGEFIDTLEESDLGLDKEDIDDLRAAPQIVRDLDSFRFFFVSAFVMPSYSRVIKAATKHVKTTIQQMGVPKELHQTIFNQVTGATSRKPALIRQKLAKLAKENKIDPADLEVIFKKIQDERVSLVDAANADYSDDFVKGAIKKWQGTNKKGRIEVVRQAMKETLENE
jgi:hypothetical protein